MLLNNNNKNDELSQLVYQIQHIQKDIQSIKSALIDNKHVSRDRYTIRQVAETAGCSVETPHKPDNVYKRFKSLLKKLEEQGEIARIEKINVHNLWKTYISHLVMKGVDPIKLMAIVGHKDFSTMKRYLHLSPKYRTDNVDVLDY